MRGPSPAATCASSASSDSSGNPTRTTPRSPWTISSVPIVVPCHRVLPGSGGVGSYGGGPARKRQLLAHEGATVRG